MMHMSCVLIEKSGMARVRLYTTTLHGYMLHRTTSIVNCPRALSATPTREQVDQQVDLSLLNSYWPGFLILAANYRESRRSNAIHFIFAQLL